MAERQLSEEQRSILLEWLAAEYSSGLIRVWAKEREWPELSDSLLCYYRKQYRREITAARKRRRNSALSRGLAVKEERVAQLNEVADELKAILWEQDNFGKMPNVQVWLKTLDDIAKEVGGRTIKTQNDSTIKQSGSMRIIVDYADGAQDPLPEEYPDDEGEDTLSQPDEEL